MAKVRYTNVRQVSKEVIDALAPVFGLSLASKMTISAVLEMKSEEDVQKACEKLYKILDKNRVVLDGTGINIK